MAFQTFRVELKGESEPLVVETNARDLAAVVMDAANPRPLDVMFQQVHNAMRRQQMPVPRDYPSFLEVLEAVPEPVDVEPDAMDPTSAAP